MIVKDNIYFDVHNYSLFGIVMLFEPQGNALINFQHYIMIIIIIMIIILLVLDLELLDHCVWYFSIFQLVL